MSGLTGIVRLDGGPVDRVILDRWKKMARTQRASQVRAGESWAATWSLPPYADGLSTDSQPLPVPGGRALFVEGRLDDPRALSDALGLDGGTRSHPALIAAAYAAWGPSAPERLYGDFAAALWDQGERSLTLARDALGTRTLFYHFDGVCVWFATALHLLLALPEVPRDLDDLGLANFMVRAIDNPEQTLYRHIFRVPPGGTVRFREGERRVQRYFTLDGIKPVRLARDEDYVEMGRSLLDAAVASRLPASGKIVTMLSGGFDSTGVTATAARLLGERGLTAITRVAGAHDPYRAFDERALAGRLAAHYPNIEWLVADELHQHDRNATPEHEASVMGTPVMVQATTWFEPVNSRAVAIGARAMLSGNWGNCTLSWTGQALCYEQVRSGHLVAAARGVAARARRRGKPFLDALRMELLPALEPRAMRRRRREAKPGRGPWQHLAMFAPGFLNSVDYDAHTDSVGHDILRKVPRSGRELRWTMMQRPQSADRMAHLRGRMPFEMLDPLRDRRMAEFTLGAPESQFQRDGVDRWLARRVLADRVPAEVLAQDGRGYQNGEWYHIASLNREKTAEAIERMARSPLASRVIDVAFLKSVFDSWPKDAEAAGRSEHEHRHMLEFGVSVGSFLRWHEGSNG